MGFWKKIFKGLRATYKTADALEKSGIPVNKIPVAGQVKAAVDIAVAIKKKKQD